MTDSKKVLLNDSPHKSPSVSHSVALREKKERLKKALRENLRKRKMQARRIKNLSKMQNN